MGTRLPSGYEDEEWHEGELMLLNDEQVWRKLAPNIWRPLGSKSETDNRTWDQMLALTSGGTPGSLVHLITNIHVI